MQDNFSIQFSFFKPQKWQLICLADWMTGQWIIWCISNIVLEIRRLNTKGELIPPPPLIYEQYIIKIIIASGTKDFLGRKLFLDSHCIEKERSYRHVNNYTELPTSTILSYFVRFLEVNTIVRFFLKKYDFQKKKKKKSFFVCVCVPWSNSPFSPVKFPTSISHRQFGDVHWLIEHLSWRNHAYSTIGPLKNFFLYGGTYANWNPPPQKKKKKWKKNAFFAVWKYLSIKNRIFRGK